MSTLPSLHGGPVAAYQLYREHHSWLRLRLQQRLGCAFDAADLAHDTFLRILARRDLADIREPRPYLATVAKGLMVNHLRRKTLERAYLESLASLPEALQPGPEARYLLLETLLEIDALLDGLPARVRQAFLLSQLDDLTYSQIAEHLGVSLSSVKQYMFKAIRHCMQPGL